MDTGDTGDTAEIREKQEDTVIISASEMAGEEGGFGCSATGISGTILAFLITITVISRRMM